MRRPRPRGPRLCLSVALALVAAWAGAEPALGAPWRDPAGVGWHVRDTERCRVHWHDGAGRTAHRVIALCDAVHRRVTAVLDHAPDGPVHVVVRDLEVVANGLALYDRRWIALWATPLDDRLRGRMDWLPAVLTHEMAHVVSLDLGDPLSTTVVGSGLRRDGARNADLGAQLVLGGGLAPFWWTEGGAEYWTELAGGNHWSTSRNMLLRSAVLEANVLDPAEWSTREGRYGFGVELGYNQGYSFGRFLRERLDQGALGRLARQYRNDPGVDWARVIEEATGDTEVELFGDWLSRANAAYADQVEAMGPEVAGTFVPLHRDDVPVGALHPAAPTDRRALWEDAAGDVNLGGGRWDRWARRRRLARPGTIHVDRLRASADGARIAWTDREGAVVVPYAIDELPPLAGRFTDEVRWDAVEAGTVRIAARWGVDFGPAARSVVVSSSRCLRESLGCLHPDGLTVPDLYVVDLETGDSRALSRGLRAVDPAWAPSGDAIAFVRHLDGESHLGLIDPASEAGAERVTWLLRRPDAWIARPRWSPDGRRLVFTMARGGRQDVWTIGRGGGTPRPLTWDDAEERDPVFGPRGRAVYYASDRTGVFNIHRADLDSGRIERLTNVVGGAFSPWVGRDGVLLYLYFTSFGFKPYVKRAPTALERVGVSMPPALEVARGLVPQAPAVQPAPDDAWWELLSPSRFPAPRVVPAMVVDGRDVSAGLFAHAEDAPGLLALDGEALVGEETWMRLRLDLGTVPAPFVEGRYVRTVQRFAVALDADLDGDTLAQDRALPVKATGRWIDGRAGLGLALGDRVTGRAWGSWLSAGSRLASDGGTTRTFYDRAGLAWSLHVDTLGVRDREGDVDPRGLSLYLEHGAYATDLPAPRWDAVEVIGRPPASGGAFDYGYQQVLLGGTWALGLPGTEALRHTLELHLRGGWISRNVSPGEELHAGGLHPLRRFRPEFSSTEFSGYEDFSVHGETLVLAGLAWRVPLVREWHRRLGPLYLGSMWLQLFGTAGNAWGYAARWLQRPDGTIDTHPYASHVPPELRGRPRVDAGSIRRERPLLDVARGNGHRLLLDAGVELRFGMRLFELPWDSLIRVAWGFQALRGPGDVNDDGVYADHWPADPDVDEREPPSLRVTVGLGTGFR